MTRPIPEEIISSWIINEEYAGIVHAHLGAFRWLIETRVGRLPCHVSERGYTCERDAVRAMFRRLDAAPPKVATRRKRRTPASWSRVGGEE